MSVIFLVQRITMKNYEESGEGKMEEMKDRYASIKCIVVRVGTIG